MSRFKDFARGLGYIKRGFHFFLQHKILWWYAVIPTILNIVILLLMIYGLGHYFSDLSSWVFGESNTAEYASLGFWLKMYKYIIFGLLWLLKAVFFLLLFVLILLFSFVLSMIITGPFNDALSEKVENIVTGKGEIPFSFNMFIKSILRTIVVELQKASFFLTIPLGLFILNVIPGIGSTIYFIIATLFASFDIGFNFVDFPMSRKLWKFKKRMKLAWSKRYLLMGFGIVSLIPLFPYFFSSPMVTGGTLIYIEVAKENESDTNS